jgi:hypothetical protein
MDESRVDDSEGCLIISRTPDVSGVPATRDGTVYSSTLYPKYPCASMTQLSSSRPDTGKFIVRDRILSDKKDQYVTVDAEKCAIPGAPLEAEHVASRLRRSARRSQGIYWERQVPPMEDWT